MFRGPLPFVLILLVVVFLVMLIVIVKARHKVQPGQALIINTPSGAQVYFTNAMVMPLIHRAEYMDTSTQRFTMVRQGTFGLVCRDNVRADVHVTFFMRVNDTVTDILNVASLVGCARATDQATLEELFGAKFVDALKSISKQLDFDDLYMARQAFADQIILSIGKDLHGYILEQVTIDHLEQTDREQLDPNNILDAEGIRKITKKRTSW